MTLFNRYFLFVTGIIGVILVLVLGYNLLSIHSKEASLDYFTNEDQKVYIINNADEFEMSSYSLDISTPMKNLTRLIFTPFSSEYRFYISSKKEKLIIESENLITRSQITALLRAADLKVYFKNQKEAIVNNQFSLEIIGNKCLIYKGDLIQNDLKEYPLVDKNATFSEVLFRQKMTNIDYYINKSGITSFQKIKETKRIIQRIDDKELFSKELPDKLTDYNFFEFDYAKNLNLFTKNSPLNDWVDQGLVLFNYEGTNCILTDIKDGVSPFDIINEYSDEYNLIEGSSQRIEDIALLIDKSKQINREFYMQMIGDKLLISERREVIHQIIEDYETAQTIALNHETIEKIYGQLPSVVSERFWSVLYSYSITDFRSLRVKVEKTKQTTSFNKQGIQKRIRTYQIKDEIVSIKGQEDIHFIWTDKNKVLSIQNGKIIWEYSFEGELIGEPNSFKLLKDGDEYVYFTTDKMIYVLNSRGNEVGDFPRKMKGKPKLAVTHVESQEEPFFYFVNHQNDFIKLSLEGSQVKKRHLSIGEIYPNSYPYTEGASNFVLLLGTKGGVRLNLSNVTIANEFPVLPDDLVFCTTSEVPSFFYFKEDKLYQNNFNGDLEIVGKYPIHKNFQLFKGRSRSYITFIDGTNLKLLDEDGDVVRTIKLQSKRVEKYQIIYLSKGNCVIIFQDDISKDIYLYTLDGRKIDQKSIEGSQLVHVSEAKNGFLVSTLGSSFLIQYKYEGYGIATN